MRLMISRCDVRRAIAAGAAITLLATPAAAEPAAPSARPGDYYAKRATEILKGEDHEPAPHPLAARAPDSIVVVCEAGCLEGAAQVVYLARREGNGARTSASSTAALGPECVAGCYAAASGAPLR